EKRLRAALRGATVAGAPVHLTGYDALQDSTGQTDGPGVLLEALFGGLGALVVLAFVFGSFLAVIPLVMAIPAILTTFLLVYGLMLIPLVSVVVAITLLPAVLGSLGPRLDRHRLRTDDKASASWTRWAQLVVRRRWVAALGAGAVLVALLVAASHLQLGLSN